jgi:hypothetical protein
MSLNLSTLLYSTAQEDAPFLSQITLTAAESDQLMEARRHLRAGLRKCLRTEVAKLTRNQVADVAPKFVTQGSVSYKTLNKPCRPPQQADLDDGIYLPLSYVQDQGQPAAAADTLFAAVAACASQVAAENGWAVNTQNARCTRVEVSDSMHIDIPLYSIPDDEFSVLREAYDSAVLAKADRSTEELEELDWAEVTSDRVLLATRDEGWLPKDPRPIREWVRDMVEEKGEQLRRVMRYVKAWRDYQTWEGEDPKSIMLMVAAAVSFDEKIDRRDDLALLATVRGMADAVRGRLPAPWDQNEDLASRLDDEPGLRDTVATRLQTFASAIDYAINVAHTAQAACLKLREVLGSRVPNRPDMVYLATEATSPATVTAMPGSVGRQNNA